MAEAEATWVPTAPTAATVAMAARTLQATFVPFNLRSLSSLVQLRWVLQIWQHQVERGIRSENRKDYQVMFSSPKWTE